MMQFIASNMAPIMFVGLVVFLLMGFSVAFSLAACGLFFGFLGIELGLLPASLMQALPPGAMLAVPLSEEALGARLSGDLSLAAVNKYLEIKARGVL